MNQIAIGDTSGWTVLEGQSIAAPYKKSSVFFTFSSNPVVREYIQIKLQGSPAQISTAISGLETIGLRATAYSLGEYPEPQLLRFQPSSGAAYYYAQISGIQLEGNINGYITHQTGSYLIKLNYNRGNWFDGAQIELPLTGRAGSDVTGGIALVNHTDVDPLDGNSVLIKKADAGGDLPGPLRIDLLNNFATGVTKDLYFGIYHHTAVISESIFFYNAATLMSGGTLYMNVGAIGSWYRSITWTSAAWTQLLTVALGLTEVLSLDGRTFRPILHLFNSHAHTDLYLRFIIKIGTVTIETCEYVYADPTYGYVLFPPIQIPPKQILREVNPQCISLILYGLKENGAVATLDIDQVCLLPMDYAASFLGFFTMNINDRFIYDNFRELSNVRDGASQLETIAHNLQGGPLMLYPNENSRLIIVLANNVNTQDIARTSVLKAYYHPRVRLL